MPLIIAAICLAFCCVVSSLGIAAEVISPPPESDEADLADAPEAEATGRAAGDTDGKAILQSKASARAIPLKDIVDYQSENAYSVAKRDRASQYFTRGKLLFDAKDYAAAAEAFRLAYETLPHQAVLGNIALCYDRAGKWPDAVVYYRKYFLDPVEHKENRSMRERLDELNDLVGEMVVECGFDDCTVRVDGISRGAAPAEVVVLPGEHRIEARVEGQIVDEAVIKIEARDIVTVEFNESDKTTRREIRAPVSEPMPNAESPVTPTSGLKSGFWVATGLTVASGAATAVLGGLALKTNRELSALPRASDVEDKAESERIVKRSEALAAKGDQLKLATNIFVGVTSTAAVIAVVLGATELIRMKKKKQHALSFVPAGPGLTLRVTF